MIQVGTIFMWNDYKYRVEKDKVIYGFRENRTFKDFIYTFENLEKMLRSLKISLVFYYPEIY